MIETLALCCVFWEELEEVWRQIAWMMCSGCYWDLCDGPRLKACGMRRGVGLGRVFGDVSCSRALGSKVRSVLTKLMVAGGILCACWNECLFLETSLSSRGWITGTI